MRLTAGAALVLLLIVSAWVLFGRAVALPMEPSLDAALDLALRLVLLVVAAIVRRRARRRAYDRDPSNQQRRRAPSRSVASTLALIGSCRL